MKRWAKIHFWGTFVGVNAIFMPMHIMGIMGHPRRYAQATEFKYLAGTQGLPSFHYHGGPDDGGGSAPFLD